MKLITFDMAGTTVHDKGYVHKAFMDAHAAFGYPISYEAANKVMGYKKPIAIEMMLKSEHGLEKDAALIDNIHGKFVQNMIDFYAHDESVREIDGVTDLFRSLKEKGIKIGLETGFSRDIADVIVKRLGWENLIDTLTASDEVAAGRPAPFMIQENMRKAGIENAQDVAKVGDTSVDLESGSAAGCKWNIGVLSGAYSREELEQYPHTHILSDATKILELLS
jgi:phosphonatase-like hydrolase